MKTTQPEETHQSEGGCLQPVVLRPLRCPLPFADTVRCAHDGIGMCFIFSDATGHVHASFRADDPVSPSASKAIGAVKIKDAWHWVCLSQNKEISD